MTESVASGNHDLADRLKAVEVLAPHDQLPAFEEILATLDARLDQEEQG